MRIMRRGQNLCGRLRVIACMTIALSAGATAVAQLDDDQRACVNSVNKGARNVGNQEQKKNRNCVREDPGDVTICVELEGAKSAAKREKLIDLFDAGGKCNPPPPFGVGLHPNGIADGAEEATRNILRGAFGDPIDGIDTASKCHDRVAKRAGKKLDTQLKAFRTCVQALPAINSAADIQTCIASSVADPKAQGTVQPKLVTDLASQCDFSFGQPPGFEDGPCSGCANPMNCAGCLGLIIDCQACLTMVSQSGVSANCDLLDDMVANDSCGCQLAAGHYTLTTGAGAFKFYTFLPFALPSATIVLDVAGASLPSCVHDTVVPFPGGFVMPTYCAPALGFFIKTTQTGCGAGKIDSNGGSDFTTIEVDDTSSPVDCGTPHPGPCTPGADAAVLSAKQLGDSVPDACAGSGFANALASVPVETLIWSDNSPGSIGGCSGDGIFDGGDILVSRFLHILDLTTDTAKSSWLDVDADACHIAGNGPATGLPLLKGECVDVGSGTIRLVAAGGFGDTLGLNDGSFSIELPGTFGLPAPYAGDVCLAPPPLNGDRCLP